MTHERATHPHEDDDPWSCLNHNAPTAFRKEDVVDIVAEVPGANDELNWWWILRLADGRHALLSAWCDYTGWDCQSAITVEMVRETAMECAEASAETEEYSRRAIRRNLVGQLSGAFPRFTYWGM